MTQKKGTSFALIIVINSHKTILHLKIAHNYDVRLRIDFPKDSQTQENTGDIKTKEYFLS